MLFTRGSSPPWDPTRISDVSRLAGRFLTASATWEARYPAQMRALFSTLPGRNLSRLSQGIPWCSLTTSAWLCKVRDLQGRRVCPHGKTFQVCDVSTQSIMRREKLVSTRASWLSASDLPA